MMIDQPPAQLTLGLFPIVGAEFRISV